MYQPVRTPLGIAWLPGGRVVLVTRAATDMAKLKLVMDTLAFTLFWKPTSSPRSATTRTMLDKW